MMTHRRWITCLAIALTAAACDADGEDAERPAAAAEPADSAAPAARTDALAADTGVAAQPDDLEIVFERRGEWTYDVNGRSSASALEISVEDGHNVLYGPAQLVVSGGAFRMDLIMETTTRPRVFAYVTEPGGARQWVVPIPLDQPRVAWSGPPEPAQPAAGN